MFSSIVQTVPSIQSGSRPALATGGAQRSPILPDLPTIDEAGLPGYVAADWWGIVAPAAGGRRGFTGRHGQEIGRAHV